jgi:hypothetical protein
VMGVWAAVRVGMREPAGVAVKVAAEGLICGGSLHRD